jgi:hypothetical protein
MNRIRYPHPAPAARPETFGTMGMATDRLTPIFVEDRQQTSCVVCGVAGEVAMRPPIYRDTRALTAAFVGSPVCLTSLIPYLAIRAPASSRF